MRYRIIRRSMAPLVRIRFWMAEFIYQYVLLAIISNEGWQERLLTSFHAGPENDILIIGDHSSYLALSLSIRFPAARMKALDSSVRAVAKTRERIAARKIMNLRLDGSQDTNSFASFADGSFHHVVCLLALHQRASERKVELLKEIARVLRHDGFLHVIELDKPENNNESKLLRFAGRKYRAAVIPHLNGAWLASVAEAGFSRIRRHSSHSIGVGRLSVVNARNRR